MSQTKPPTEDAQALLAVAKEHHKARRFAEAEAAYGRLIAADGGASEPRYLLGMLLVQTGRNDQALTHLREVVRLAPDNLLGLRALGHASLAARRAEEAADAFGRLATLRPDLAEAHFGQGNALRDLGRMADAVPAYRRAVAADPKSPHARVNLGIVLQGIAAYDEAVSVLREAAELAPDSYAARYNLGYVLSLQRRFDEAAEAYRSALALDPDSAGAHLNLGSVLQSQHKVDEAIVSYRRAIAAAPDLVQAHINLAAALHEKQDAKGAVEALRHATALDPANIQAQVNLAQSLQAIGDSMGAEEAYRQVLERHPGHVGALGHFSIALQQIGKRDEAKRLLDYPALLKPYRLTRPAGYADTEALNTALDAYAHAHPTLMKDPPAKATKYGSQTMEILNAADAPIVALQHFFEESVADYMKTALASAKYEFAPKPPASWKLHGWAVILRSSGHQSPHFHPAGVVSGVYYVRVPKTVRDGGAGEAGHIRFGHPLLDVPGAKAAEPALTAAFKPEEGMLILFPSYFWHHTVPFESDEERISIAFDAIPAGAPVEAGEGY
ncbi:MAG: tetratricopeptide repeat protein [Alphaproteobacteria bacterium]